MSQILVSDFGENDSLLFQDLYFVKKKTIVQTTVQEAICVICKKGLEDGASITAKRIELKSRLFCQYHMPDE